MTRLSAHSPRLKMTKAKKKAANPKRDRGLCQCDDPRTTIKKAIDSTRTVGPSAFATWLTLRCDRCRLPLAQAAVQGRHRHCWHPDSRDPSAKRFNLVAHQLGSGQQRCICCLCGQRMERRWHTEPVPQHGPHWRVLVKVFEDS